MNILNKMLTELVNEPELDGADAYDWMKETDEPKDNGNNTSSWAIWDSENLRNTKYVSDNKHLANPRYMVLGMNQSIPIDNENGIFHTEAATTPLANSFLNGPMKRYYGAYITDLLNVYDMDTKKLIYMPKSADVIKFFNDTVNNKEAIKYSKERFFDKYNALKDINGTPPIIKPMGKLANKYANKWLKDEKDVIIKKFRHSSNVHGDQFKYDAHVAYSEADGDISLMDSIYHDYAIKRNKKIENDANEAKMKKLRSRLSRIFKKGSYDKTSEIISLVVINIDKMVNKFHEIINNETAPGVIHNLELKQKKLLRYKEHVLEEQDFLNSIAEAIDAYMKGAPFSLSVREVERLETIILTYKDKKIFSNEVKGFTATGNKVINLNYIKKFAGLPFTESINLNTIIDNILLE